MTDEQNPFAIGSPADDRGPDSDRSTDTSPRPPPPTPSPSSSPQQPSATGDDDGGGHDTKQQRRRRRSRSQEPAGPRCASADETGRLAGPPLRQGRSLDGVDDVDDGQYSTSSTRCSLRKRLRVVSSNADSSDTTRVAPGRGDGLEVGLGGGGSKVRRDGDGQQLLHLADNSACPGSAAASAGCPRTSPSWRGQQLQQRTACLDPTTSRLQQQQQQHNDADTTTTDGVRSGVAGGCCGGAESVRRGHVSGIGAVTNEEDAERAQGRCSTTTTGTDSGGSGSRCPAAGLAATVADVAFWVFVVLIVGVVVGIACIVTCVGHIGPTTGLLFTGMWAD